MDTKKLFLRVCAYRPLTQAEFLGFFGDAVRFFTARYDDEIIAPESAVNSNLSTLEDDCGLDEIFADPIVSYILSLKTGEGEKRAAALLEFDYAFRKLWRKNAKDKSIKHIGW